MTKRKGLRAEPTFHGKVVSSSNSASYAGLTIFIHCFDGVYVLFRAVFLSEAGPNSVTRHSIVGFFKVDKDAMKGALLFVVLLIELPKFCCKLRTENVFFSESADHMTEFSILIGGYFAH